MCTKANIQVVPAGMTGHNGYLQLAFTLSGWPWRVTSCKYSNLLQVLKTRVHSAEETQVPSERVT